MKIECKAKREGGSVIDIGGIAYEFKPLADGAHVADVKSKEHVERFLSIPDTYCIYDGKAKAETPVVEEAPVTEEEVAPGVDDAASDEDLPTETVEPVADELDALKAEYKAKFGSAPHYKWSAETIKAKLAE